MGKYVLQFYDILVLFSKLEDMCLIITPSFPPPRAPPSLYYYYYNYYYYYYYYYYSSILLLLLVISFTKLGSFLFPAFTPARVFDQPPMRLGTDYQPAGTNSSSRSYT